MKLRCHLRSFSLPLKRPLTIAGQAMLVRHGFYLLVVDDDGCCGIGEASPLPRRSRESLAQTNRFLQKLEYIEAGHSLTDAWKLWRTQAQDAPASAVFAGEMALANYWSMRSAQDWPSLLRSDALRSIALQGLLVNRGEAIKRAQTLQAKGYHAIKWKIGHGAPRRERRLLDQLAQMDVRLRLDANQKLSSNAADCLFANLSTTTRDAIEYVEEPCASPQQSRKMADHYNLPLAFDESTEADKVLPPHQTIVFKPQIHGSIARLEQANDAVISSAFESSIGLAYLACVAAAFSTKAAGIDTAAWIAEDFPVFRSGRAEISHAVDFANRQALRLRDSL